MPRTPTMFRSPIRSMLPRKMQRGRGPVAPQFGFATGCPAYTYDSSWQAVEVSWAIACHAEALSGDTPLDVNAIADCAYKEAYPDAPFPIPKGYQQLANCSAWAEAWMRIHATVAELMQPGPPTTPEPNPPAQRVGQWGAPIRAAIGALQHAGMAPQYGFAQTDPLTPADVVYLKDRSLRFWQAVNNLVGVSFLSALSDEGLDTVARLSAIALAGEDVDYNTGQPSVGYDPAKASAGYHLVRNNVEEWFATAFPGAPLPAPPP